jgi:hypothetical protein
LIFRLILIFGNGEWNRNVAIKMEWGQVVKFVSCGRESYADGAAMRLKG